MAKKGVRAGNSVRTMILRALLPAAAAAVLIAAPAQAAPVSVTYTAVGESVFTVPDGVHAVDVSLTGARGGSFDVIHFVRGGRGATVSGRLAVTPGQKLYAEVGGPGENFTSGSSTHALPGGANGGGAGHSSGGGASDLRTLPAGASGSLATRVAVAGGGGGAGWGLGVQPVGGDAGVRGTDPSGGQAGGHPGTLTAGGVGGKAPAGSADGTNGTLGQGGEAVLNNYRGGGGGGGLYGGGGGAGHNSGTLIGGGGGGSSLVPTAGTSGLAGGADPAQVTISYEGPTAAVSATRIDFAVTQPGAVSPSHTLEVTNTASSTDLNVSPTALATDDFVLGASTCDGWIAPGQKCRIAVRYAPSAHGHHATKLRINTSAGPLTVDLAGESVAPEPTTTAPAPVQPATTQAAPVVSTRLHCTAKRCTVAFANAPRIAKNGTRVRATLTQGGRVYATADVKARRGTLRLVLKNRRAVKSGTYTLKLQIGAKRTTQTAIA